MKKKAFRSTFSELLSAALFTVIGIVLVAFLQKHYSTAMLVIGCVLALIGAIKIIRFLTNQDKRASDIVSLLVGALFVLGAVVVFARFKPILDLATIFLGAYILLSAFMRFFNIRKLGKFSNKKLLVPTVLAGIEALCGLFCISSRALLPDALFQAAGGALMLFGLLDIAIILMTAGARKAARNA